MNEELLKMLESMHEAMHDCKCKQNDCRCPVANMLELDAAQFAHRASNVHAAAMESYQLATAAQNQLLLQMQATQINNLSPSA